MPNMLAFAAIMAAAMHIVPAGAKIFIFRADQARNPECYGVPSAAILLLCSASYELEMSIFFFDAMMSGPVAVRRARGGVVMRRGRGRRRGCGRGGCRGRGGGRGGVGAAGCCGAEDPALAVLLRCPGLS